MRKKLSAALVIVLLFAAKAQAQFTATWALTTDKTVVVAGVQAANVNAGSMVPGANFVANGAHNIDGFKCQQTLGNWPSVATDNDNIDFPLSPIGAVNVAISGLTLTAKTSGSSGNSMISLAYQVDGAGAWTAFGTPQAAPSGGTTNIDFGVLSTVLNTAHTYVVRMYVYAAGASTSQSRSVFIKNVVITGTTPPPGTVPTVLTTAAAATGLYTGTGSGNITSASLTPISASGICWSTAANPTAALSTKTINGPTGTGTYTHPITGLTAGTTYHVRAYATNAVGTGYGTDLTFITNAPIAPTVTTNTITGISPIFATGGGNVTDSGGVLVTARGVCWNTTGTPTTANSKTIDGVGAGTFVSSLTGLTPSTTYYVRAYATNSINTSYGNQVTFTTSAPTPILTITPTSLNFGTVVQNTISPQQTYSLAGYFLSPAAGDITITAPAGFRVSSTSGTGFAPSITIPYTGNTLPATTIYVRFSPTNVINYTGNVTNTGGGAPVANVAVSGSVTPANIQSGQGFSNKGKNFWVGYGATEKMYGDNSQDMRFTLNNPNAVAATVTFSMPNLPGFTPIVYTVPANSIVTTNPDDWPESGTNDCRLKDEGVTNRGINIVSTQDIVIYCHAITSSVYAASVLFPTNTLGREYTSLNFTQRANTSIARSFCFAIATEDNTQLQVTLPAGISTETHAAGSTFTQTLNKGEVLNLFGTYTGQPNLHTGLDLTGTVVKSISTGINTCKPFAFYCGSSKITIDCDNGSNGSADNLFQQMFPKVAWGYKYITVPTQVLDKNYYRILVADPTTVVKVNGIIQGGIINNTYYQYFNNASSIDVIEGDKPIMVAQYMTTHGECGNNNGSNGDPDMIYLSSVEQTTDTVSLVSSPLGNTSGRQHFINVTAKTAELASFKLDGVLQAPAFNPVLSDPTFSYASFNVAEGFHSLTSSKGFNATAYGIAGDESYGYNAGTNVKDLLSGFGIQNQYGTGTASQACRGNEFYMSVTLPYLATSITWDFANNPNLTPNAAVTQLNPVPASSYVLNGKTLYVFKLATPYIYNTTGSFPVKVTSNNPTPDGCNGLQDFTFTVTVGQAPTASFDFTNTSGCLAPIQFTNNSTAGGGNLDLWQWDFGDLTNSTLQNPSHTYAAGGSYSVKLRAITLEGCYDDTIRIINLSSVPVANFTSNAQGCVGQPETFINTATIASGTITQWIWNFGDATPVVNAATGVNQVHTFANAGTFTVTLTVVSSTGCTSTVVSKQIVINPLPTVTFAALAATCTGSTPFALTGGSPATVAGVGTGVYSGTGVSAGIFNPAVAGAGTFTITYTYTTVLGCIKSVTQTIVVTQSFNLTIGAVAPLCTNNQPVTLVPSVAGGVFSGPGISGSTFNPAQAGVGTHTISYAIPGNGCSLPGTRQIVVNPAPTVNAGPDITTIQGNAVTLSGTASAGTYLWTPSTGLFNPTGLATSANPSATTTYTLTATNSFGCAASDAVIVNVTAPCVNPPNAFTPNNDGSYDKWVVYTGGCTKSVKVDVYNRWGSLVYHSDNYANDWNGTYNNKTLPDATYYYVVQATLIGDYKITLKGNVTILR